MRANKRKTSNRRRKCVCVHAQSLQKKSSILSPESKTRQLLSADWKDDQKTPTVGITKNKHDHDNKGEKTLWTYCIVLTDKQVSIRSKTTKSTQST